MLGGFKTQGRDAANRSSALKDFSQDVAKGSFLAPEHCYKMPESEILKMKELLEKKG